MKQYWVIPFTPAISEKVASKEGAATVAGQLQELLNRVAADGWNYDAYEMVEVSIKPGCLAIFVKPSTVLYANVIVSREVPGDVPRHAVR